MGEESQWAAEAAECANDQNMYWEYHDKLFDEQSGENQGAFSKDNLKGFAADLGMDTDAFGACMDSGKFTEMVRSDSQLASQIGVSSTPSFLVNGTPLIGAQPLSAFEAIINTFVK